MADTPNLWDRPVQTLQQQMDPLYLFEPLEKLYIAIGRAITMWGGVEGRLSDAFLAMVGSSDKYAAWKMFNEPESFRTKVGIFKTYAEAKFSRRKDDLEATEIDHLKWKYISKLLDYAAKISPRRNDIAHGIIVVSAHDGTRGYLREHFYKQSHNRRIKGLGPEYEFSATHIEGYTDLFKHLEHEFFFALIILGGDQGLLAAKWNPTPLSPNFEPMKSDLQKKLKRE